MSRDLDMYVLDALSNDLEQVENVQNILNSDTEFGWRDRHPAPFTRTEIITSLLRGLQAGTVEACVYTEDGSALTSYHGKGLPPDPLDRVWFRLTRRGQLVLDNWDAPQLPEQ